MPVPERAAFWTAVGPHNRVVEEQSRWVEVPAGRFWFGAAPGDEAAERREQPARVVQMSAFRIQRWAVTVAEFAAFVDAGGYGEEGLWSLDGWVWRTSVGIDSPEDWPVPGRPHHPIVGVSWWEAEAYCKWLTQKLNRHVSLPTEAQWEYAARGPFVEGETIPRYPWGWEDEPNRRAGEGSRVATVPPGVFPGGVGWKGTWDQSGSVWEWCSDEPGGRLPGGDRDPYRPAATGGSRALRGGSFVFAPRYLRVSYRRGFDPQWRDEFLGFRCVLPEGP
ncbi:MAG: SUMF1/EgtB/PvdO family nonheme iron enzyme [bacterium]